MTSSFLRKLSYAIPTESIDSPAGIVPIDLALISNDSGTRSPPSVRAQATKMEESEMSSDIWKRGFMVCLFIKNKAKGAPFIEMAWRTLQSRGFEGSVFYLPPFFSSERKKDFSLKEKIFPLRASVFRESALHHSIFSLLQRLLAGQTRWHTPCQFSPTATEHCAHCTPYTRTPYSNYRRLLQIGSLESSRIQEIKPAKKHTNQLFTIAGVQAKTMDEYKSPLFILISPLMGI